MVDPVALGLTVATLAAKAAFEKAGQQAGAAGWGALGEVVERVRSWFARRGDQDGEKALAVVEAAPDSQRAIETLAGTVTAAAEQDPQEAGELARLVDKVGAEGGGQVTGFVNQVRDQARVGRIIQVSGTYNERG